MSVEEHNLIELLESISQQFSEGEETHLRFIWALGELYDQSLGEVDVAIKYYEQYRDLAEDLERALNPLTLLYRTSERWRDLMDTYTVQLDFASETSDREQILVHMGLLYENQLDNLEEARSTYLNILDDDSESLQGIRGMQRVAELEGDQDQLSKYINAELDLCKSSEDQANLHHRLGEITLRADGEDAAFEHFERALSFVSLHEPSIRALEPLLDGGFAVQTAHLIEPFARAHEEWALLRTLLKVLIESSEDPLFRREALREVAEIEETKLSDLNAAFETYQELLIELPESTDTILSLERLAADLDLWVALSDHYIRFAYEGDLAEEARVQISSDEQDLQNDDAELSVEGEDTGDADAELSSDDDAELSSDDDAELSSDDESTNDDGGAPPSKGYAGYPAWVGAFSRRLAQLFKVQLDDIRSARDTIEKILSIEGDELILLQEIGVLCESIEDWDHLIDNKERTLKLLSTPQDKISTLFSMAKVWRDTLSTPEEAISLYQRILEIDLRDETAARELEVLLKTSHRYDDLSAHLEAQLEGIDGEAQQAIGFQLAQLKHQKLGDPMGALGQFESVLAAGPHPETVNAIEHLLSTHHDGSEEARLIRNVGCDLLTPIYVESQEWAPQIHLLEIRLEDEEDAETRISLHQKIAILLEEHAEDPASAFDRYGKALHENFAYADVRQALNRLADLLDRWDDFATLVKAGIENDLIDEPETRLDMILLVANLYEERLEQPEMAISFFNLALQDGPDDRLVLAELSRLYELMENYDDFAAILTTQVELYTEDEDQEARVQFAFKLASLYEEHLEDLERAIELYQQIRMEIAPEDSRSYLALERLYLNLSRYDGLVEVYLDEASQLEALEDKKIRLYKAASVYETSLSALDDAVGVYQMILTEDASDETSLNELARLFNVLNRYEDQLSIFNQQKELCQEERDQDQYELKRALIYRDHMNDATAALESLQAVITHQPDSQQAIEALESLLEHPEVKLEASKTLAPIYEATEQYEALVRVLKLTREERFDLDEQVEILCKVAELEEVMLEKPEDAFESLSIAYRLSQAEESIEVELERIGRETQAFATLVELFNELVMEAPEREIEIRSKVASLSEVDLQDFDQAINAHREILNQEPDRIESLDALERLFGLNDDPESLIDILHQKLEVIEAPDQRVTIFENISTLYEKTLSQPQEAISAWRSLLEEVEGHPQAQIELERLLIMTEAYSELSAHYEEWIELCEDAQEITKIKTRLADVYEKHLQDGMMAVDLYREALELTANYEPAHAALADLFTDEERSQLIGADRKLIAEVLEPHYREKGDQTELISILDVQQSGELDPTVRGPILLELAQLQEQVAEDRQAAFESRLEALKAIPDDLDNRLVLQRLAHIVHGYQELAMRLDEVAEEALDLTLKCKLLLELGKVYESFLEEYERAGDCYHEILAHLPGHDEAIRALEALFARLSQYQELVDLYIKLAEEHDDDEQKIRRYIQACETLHNIDESDQLIETYRRVLEIDELNETAFKELERLFKLTDRWMELSELLIERIESLEDVAIKSDMRHKLAHVYLDHLDQTEEAIEVWRTTLEEQSDYEDAYLALEQLAAQWRPLGQEEPRRSLIAEILEPLYESKSQWMPWMLTQDDLIEFSFDPLESAERLKVMAKINEDELNDVQGALRCLARAFKLDFGEPALQDEIDRLAESSEAWSTLIEIYTDGIDLFSDPEEGLKLWMKIARTYETKLEDIDRAVESYRTAHRVDPMNISPLNDLERIFKDHGRASDLVDVLIHKSQVIEDLDEKKALLFWTGALYRDALSQPEEAIEIYGQILLEDPEDLKAIETLESLYHQEQRWDDLVYILQNKLSLQEEDKAQIETLHQIAQLYELELNQPSEASIQLRQILDLDPLDPTALQNLKRDLREHAQWGELIALYEDERGHYEDEQMEAIRLDLDIAQLHAEVIQDAQRAIEIYSDILSRSPVEEEAKGALEYFMSREDTQFDASLALEEHYKSTEDYSALIRVYDAQLLCLEDSFERLKVLKTQAKIKRDQLEDLKGAFHCFYLALLEDITDEESLEALQHIGGLLSCFTEMAAAYAEIAQRDPQSEMGVALYRYRAKLCAHRLNQPEEAIQSWQAVLSVEPDNAEALKAISQLFESSGKWVELIETLRIRVELDPDEFKLRLTLADLLDRVEHDSEGAIEQCKLILLDFPHVKEAQEALEARFHLREHLEEIALTLEPIYRDQEDWDKMVALNDALLTQEVIADPLRQEEIWTESAELLINQLNDPQRALEYFCQALILNPAESSIRERIFPLIDELKAWKLVIPVLERTVKELTDPELLCNDHLRLAKWSEVHLSDVDRALLSYRDALRVDSQCEEALQALSRIYEAQSAWDLLAQTLQTQLESSYDDDVRAQLLNKLATLFSTQLNRADDAIQMYEELLLIDETDAETYTALEALLTGEDQASQRLQLLERKGDALDLNDAQKAQVYCQIGAIAQQQGDLYRGSEAYREALELDETSSTAVEALLDLYPKIQDWDALRELQNDRLKTLEGPERTAGLMALATLCSQRLMMPDDALEYYQEILKITPSHAPAFNASSAILREESRFSDLAELLESFVDASADLPTIEAVSLRIEIARLADEEGETERATQRLDEAIALDPNAQDAIELLGQIKAREED